MKTCLNPYQSHPALDEAPQRLLCMQPNCGFLLSGTVLNRWLVTNLLMRGPVADLYLAVDSERTSGARSEMLVKILRTSAGRVPQIEARLEQLLMLRHPHVHPLQEAGWLDEMGALYLLSPYERQGPLSLLHGNTMQLPPLAVASIVRQISEAVQYAHEQHVVHGRLKLQNCFLIAPATIQVSDFYRVLLAPNAPQATSSSLAPEQLQGQIEPATDQYALAFMTHQLLSDQSPGGRGGVETALVQPPPSLPRPLSEIRPDLPRQVDMTLRRALSWQPSERFPTILAFATALQSALESSSTPSYPSRAPRSLPPFESPGGYSTSFPNAPATPRYIAPVCVLPGHTSAATVLAWAPDGVHLASGGADLGIHLWRVQNRIGAPFSLLTGQTGEVRALRWSPDNRLVASGSADSALRIWDISQAAPYSAWRAHDGAVAALEWSRDGGTLCSGGTDRTIRLWDRQGTPLRAWQAHGRGGVTALAWSPDGQLLASGGADRVIQVWDPSSGTLLLTYVGQNDEIRHLAWSADSAALASFAGKKDLRVCLWSRQSSQPIASLEGHTRELVGLFWANDGAWLATASLDNTLRFWNTQRRLGEQLMQPYAVQAPLAMAGAPATGMIALGLSDMLIQVLQYSA